MAEQWLPLLFGTCVLLFLVSYQAVHHTPSSELQVVGLPLMGVSTHYYWGMPPATQQSLRIATASHRSFPNAKVGRSVTRTLPSESGTTTDAMYWVPQGWWLRLLTMALVVPLAVWLWKTLHAAPVPHSVNHWALVTTSAIRTPRRRGLHSEIEEASAATVLTTVQKELLSKPAATPPGKRPLVVIIAGPTGVGKSSVAMTLCKRLRGALVSADSVQIYEGLDVGSNKPSHADQQTVPHHLIDVVDPEEEEWNASKWHKAALQTIQQLTAATPTAAGTTAADTEEWSWTVPVVVGGTMMWLQWLVHGCPDAPPPSPEAAARAASVVASYKSAGYWDGAVELLASKGEPFATRAGALSRNDWYRLERALTVAEDASQLNSTTPDQSVTVYSGESRSPLADTYDVRAFFLVPDDRMAHASRLDARCEKLLMSGLLEETGRLLCVGKLMPGSPASRAIGYRQAIEYLCRSCPSPGDEAALDAFLSEFMTATRRYAKEQMKWFRKEEEFLFIPVPVTAPSDLATEQVAHELLGYCTLDAEAFDQLVHGRADQAARVRNETQGRGMRVFQSMLKGLQRGEPARRALLAEADFWTFRCHRHLSLP